MKKLASLTALLTLVWLVPAISREKIPDDPEVIIGKLDNGLTYYVRHHDNPKGCAEFYIVHNVGALQEEDNQNGLAHFLEHMAFNGTRNYPDKEILNFLAKEGVRFGYNVNAYTSKTETVYNISRVPLVRDSFIDSVLMVLHDWSCDISCEQDALDDERGVISEEWRRRDDTRTRMAMKQLELSYKGSKHAERNVLGTLEIINGFKRDEILDFYHKWYRPDLQAIIVVGDFDAAAMEKKIRTMFSDIPAPVNPAQKEIYKIPELKEPLFENMNDPQIKYVTLKVIHRQDFPDREERGTMQYLKDLNTRQIITSIVEERFRRAAQKKDSPVKSSVLVTNASNTDFHMSLFTIVPKNDDMLEDILYFYTEMKKVLEFGITEDEFIAAKDIVAKKFRLNIPEPAENVTSETIVNFCKENFLRGIPCIFPSEYKNLQKKALEEVTYDEACGYLDKMFRDSEKIYSYSINESKEDKIPSRERMMEIIAEAESREVEPEYLSYKKLDLNTSAEPGSITGISALKGFDAEIWKLSNGATVYWIPSDSVNAENHVCMKIFFETGYGIFPKDRTGASILARNYISRYAGFSNMDKNEIRTSPGLSGVSEDIRISMEAATLTMNSDRKNAENGFRMAWLQLTNPNFSEERTLEKYRKDNRSSLEKEKSTIILFGEEAEKAKFGSHPWAEPLDTADLKYLDMDLVKEIYADAFSVDKGMTVYIASDMDRTFIQEIVCKYIASLKLEGKPARKDGYGPMLPVYRGVTMLDKTYPVQSAPKTKVSYSFLTKDRNNLKTRLCFDIIDYIMSSRCIAQIREKRGGTYHVSFATEHYNTDGRLYESTISFESRPEITDTLVGDIKWMMDDMSVNGPSAEELDNAVKYLIKKRNEINETAKNSLYYKMTRCIDSVRYGIDDTGYEKVIQGIGTDDIRKLAKKINTSDKLISIYREQ